MTVYVWLRVVGERVETDDAMSSTYTTAYTARSELAQWKLQLIHVHTAASLPHHPPAVVPYASLLLFFFCLLLLYFLVTFLSHADFWLYEQSWLQFPFVVIANVLKMQISKFYPHILSPEASYHTNQSPIIINIGLKANFCARLFVCIQIWWTSA